MTTDVFCAEASIEAEEGVFGSAATETDTWLVLEHDSAWAPKPLPELELPPGVRERIEQWLEAIAGSRLQLVKTAPGLTPDTRRRFWIGRSTPHDPWLLRFDLAGYEDLLGLDVPQIAKTGEADDAVREDRPFYLVCTHGKRDRCCAKWGLRLWDAMYAQLPERAWQTTHLGGHRFAANVLELPRGLSYGRMTEDDTRRFLDAHERGEMHDVEQLRGRTCWSGAVQAAECYLRRETRLTALEAPELLETHDEGERTTRVRFALPDGTTRDITVREEDTGHIRPKSCGDEALPATRFLRV